MVRRRQGPLTRKATCKVSSSSNKTRPSHKASECEGLRKRGVDNRLYVAENRGHGVRWYLTRTARKDVRKAAKVRREGGEKRTMPAKTLAGARRYAAARKACREAREAGTVGDTVKCNQKLRELQKLLGTRVSAAPVVRRRTPKKRTSTKKEVTREQLQKKIASLKKGNYLTDRVKGNDTDAKLKANIRRGEKRKKEGIKVGIKAGKKK